MAGRSGTCRPSLPARTARERRAARGRSASPRARAAVGASIPSAPFPSLFSSLPPHDPLSLSQAASLYGASSSVSTRRRRDVHLARTCSGPDRGGRLPDGEGGCSRPARAKGRSTGADRVAPNAGASLPGGSLFGWPRAAAARRALRKNGWPAPLRRRPLQQRNLPPKSVPASSVGRQARTYARNGRDGTRSASRLAVLSAETDRWGLLAREGTGELDSGSGRDWTDCRGQSRARPAAARTQQAACWLCCPVPAGRRPHADVLLVSRPAGAAASTREGVACRRFASCLVVWSPRAAVLTRPSLSSLPPCRAGPSTTSLCYRILLKSFKHAHLQAEPQGHLRAPLQGYVASPPPLASSDLPRLAVADPLLLPLPQRVFSLPPRTSTRRLTPRSPTSRTLRSSRPCSRSPRRATSRRSVSHPRLLPCRTAPSPADTPPCSSLSSLVAVLLLLAHPRGS